ncbi:dihydroorotase [Marinilactibacillus psychrotolerans]|uniref:Dihydroorotase n=1 Tax=Marinilactibacillus psychrotolerans TaxID=191770 RepID=A0AAV3WNW3_9LACT|nr:dihydroorotase [Marinilactibacillus psychrotolerans]GEL66162.1 dihydroorotase [Marinilactibacillus psychrotolerans]GEQ34671.1 dihydroorotase [Marinilactibacillus psychrotolerans]SDB95993.1 dihydroorotase [Marinilactibacillus psychrotolerans]
MKLLIKNARIIGNHDFPTDILIEDSTIKKIGMDLKVSAEKILNAKGKLVTPGLIDVHVHLREPGFEYKETISTGTAAAARGGFTTICAMPNVNPAPDSVKKMQNIQRLISKSAKVKVKQYAPITEQLTSDRLTDQRALVNAGAFAFTNDGVGVQTAATMYLAMKEAAKNKVSIIAHTEDDSLLFDGGVMHEGKRNKELNLPGMSQLTESTQIARDVLLAEATGVHYHICHVSAKESVRVIRDAKKAGINVTAEVTPHHLLMSEEDILSDNSLFKMNPPLRSKADQEALLEGLLDGTIDMIATDHAPHSDEEKQGSMIGSPFGIIGSETAFSLLYTNLVKTRRVTLEQLVEWLTSKPAEIFNMYTGRLEVGAPADLACFDLQNKKIISKEMLHSKSSNTPFIGWKIYGDIYFTIVDGQVIYQEEN